MGKCCLNCIFFDKISDSEFETTLKDSQGYCRNENCLWDGMIRGDTEGTMCPDFEPEETNEH